MKLSRLLFAILATALVSVPTSFVLAQNTAMPTGSVAVQTGLPYYSVTPISATAAVNTQTTLTIPAVAGLYNYVCYLAYELSADGTGAAVSNAVSTSTNFNAFAAKVSLVATASVGSGVQVLLGGAQGGSACAKSTIAGTATTFVSTASLTHTAWTWYATYYQAP